MSKTVLTLEYPVELKGETLTELSIRRAKARDLEMVDLSRRDMKSIITLVANLTGRAPEEIRELDAADFAKVSEVVTGFLDPSAAGSKSGQ